MKGNFISAIIMVGILIIINGCTHSHGPDSHTHGINPIDQLDPESHTIWTERLELFVDFPPLIVGDTSQFAVHFSDMQTYKPIKEGIVSVSLLNGDQQILKNETQISGSPGIFVPFLVPENEGAYDLKFVLSNQIFQDTIIIQNITVHPDRQSAIDNKTPIDNADEISFLKEQAWRVDFAIEKVENKSIHEVIQTSGEILPVKGEQKLLSAKRNGIVLYRSQKLQEGLEVKKGEPLFSISSKGMMQSNLKEKYEVAKAKLEKTKSNFERAEELLKQQIIGNKEYEMRKMEFSIAKSEFETLSSNYKEGGITILSPISGIVKNVMVSDGQFVEEGEPLINISRNRRLLLQAEVSQRHLSLLPKIKTANFRTPYQDRTYSIDDFNGKLVSYGKMLDGDMVFIPVLFEVDNRGDLLPGSFVEMFLLANQVDNSLVIPKSALMQDYSVKYVYIQTAGESFEKREVKLGIDDGVNVQILSGINEGEWIVTKGAYQIKMASMSSTIPDHGHEH